MDQSTNDRLADERTTQQRLGAVAAEISAVSKNGTADKSMGGYSFRRIEDVMNVMHPLLSRHSLVLNVDTIHHELHPVDVKVSGGVKRRIECLVKCAYSVTGPSGDPVPLGSFVGEAHAYDDKATNKAYSAALKLFLLQTFMIPTADAVDTEASVDHHAGEPVHQGPPLASQAHLDAVASLVKQLEEGAPKDTWEASDERARYADQYRLRAVTASTATAAVSLLQALCGVEPDPSTEPF